MRKVFTLLLLLALNSALCAQRAGAHGESNSATEGEIKALESRLVELIIGENWDEYAKHLAADYLHTRENGQLENKDEALASLRDVKRRVIVMEMEPASFVVRVHGEMAVSNAEFTVRVRDSGQVKSRVIRLTDVFVKCDGEWCLAADQSTTIGK